MQYKNAAIRDKAEAQRRLEEGEVFYYLARGVSATKIMYDKAFIRRGQSPYRFNGMALEDVWDRYDEWQVEYEAKWYDDIPKHGILCWVSDGDHLVKRHMGIVIGYTPGEGTRYDFDTTYTHFKFAVPATREEIEVYTHDS